MPHLIVAGVAPQTALPMGMDKSGNQPVSTGASNVKLVGWVARSGYANTVISNDELIASGPGAVLAQCRVQLTATWTSQYLPVAQLMHNDAAVASREVDFNTSSVTLPSTQLTLAAGDRVWVRLTNNNPLGGLTVAGGANTYVYYDLV